MAHSEYNSISNDTRMKDLGVPLWMRSVVLEEVFNVPADSWEGELSILEFCMKNSLKADSILKLLRFMVPVLPQIILSVEEGAADKTSAERRYYYKNQCHPIYESVARAWKFGEEIHRLLSEENGLKIIFCDLDPAWNLSAALSWTLNKDSKAFAVK